MSIKKNTTTICSFCLNDFPDKSLYIVSVPVNREDPNSFKNLYGTPCCSKCLEIEKERYIRITEHPSETKKKLQSAKN